MSSTTESVVSFILGAATSYIVSNHTKSCTSDTSTNKKKKPVRVYVDGCWDVMHSGHYNAIRQAKTLGDILVVGVHSDAEITRNKREPVMNNEQRMAAVRACKWADEVVFDVPYAPSLALLDKLNCDYIAHGDDMPVAVNGESAYVEVMDRLKIFRRTPGVSTTHLIQRLLTAAKSQGTPDDEDTKTNPTTDTPASWSSFLASSSRIAAFSNNRNPKKDDVVVYIDGIFDLFHVGHIAALKKAKSLGTFLYVGLYDDETVRARKGKYFPLTSLQERVLTVLSCKYVDDVLIGSPWKITKQVLKSLNVKHVVVTPNTLFAEGEMERYDVAKRMNMLREVETESEFTTDALMDSIVRQQEKLQRQNANRVQKAKQYVEEHNFVEENL